MEILDTTQFLFKDNLLSALLHLFSAADELNNN